MGDYGQIPGVPSNKFCPLTTYGIRRSKVIPYAFDGSGTATATYTETGTWYGYLGVNTGMTARVVRMQLCNTGATDKIGSATTNPVFCVYKDTIAGADGISLAVSTTCQIGQVIEGPDEEDGPIFGPTDRMIAAILTTGVSASALYLAGAYTITVEYVEGPDEA